MRLSVAATHVTLMLILLLVTAHAQDKGDDYDDDEEVVTECEDVYESGYGLPLALLATKPFVTSTPLAEETNTIAKPKVFISSDDCQPPPPTIRSLIWEHYHNGNNQTDWDFVEDKLKLHVMERVKYVSFGVGTIKQQAAWRDMIVKQMIDAGEHYFRVGFSHLVDIHSIKDTDIYRRWLKERTCVREEVTTIQELEAISRVVDESNRTLNYRRKSLRAASPYLQVEWPGLEDAVRRVEKELWPLHHNDDTPNGFPWRKQQPIHLVPRLRSILTYDVDGEFTRHTDTCDESNQEAALVLDLGFRGNGKQSDEEMIAEHYTPGPPELFFEQVEDWESTNLSQSVINFMTFHNVTIAGEAAEVEYIRVNTMRENMREVRKSGLGGQLAGEWKADGPGSWAAFPMFRFHGAHKQTSGKRVVAIFSLLNEGVSECNGVRVRRLTSCSSRFKEVKGEWHEAYS